MHRAKSFMHDVGETIMNHMEKMGKDASPANLAKIAEMAEDYNEIADFLECHEKMKNGTEWHADVMMKPGAPMR